MKIVSMRDKLKGCKCFICKVKGCIGQSQLKAFCSIDCQAKLGLYLLKKNREADEKARRKETKQRLEAVKSRPELYSLLETKIRWIAKHIKYKGESCYTCGKPQRPTDSGLAFHAGHYRSVGACKELRFNLRNIRIQCYKCNSMNSGMRKEYSENIVLELGQSELDWLDGPHESLKVVFPTRDDIRDEIAKQNKIIREYKKTL